MAGAQASLKAACVGMSGVQVVAEHRELPPVSLSQEVHTADAAAIASHRPRSRVRNVCDFNPGGIQPPGLMVRPVTKWLRGQ